MARWFMGSLSASLAEAAEVPVTVVRIAGSEDETVTDAIANALTPGDKPVHYTQPQPVVEELAARWWLVWMVPRLPAARSISHWKKHDCTTRRCM